MNKINYKLIDEKGKVYETARTKAYLSETLIRKLENVYKIKLEIVKK